MRITGHCIALIFLWTSFAVAGPGDNIGPSISDELATAGVVGLPFAWNPKTGQVRVDDPRLTDAQRTAILAVFAAHNPTKPSAAQQAEKAKTKARTDLIAHCTDIEADTTMSVKMQKLCGLLKLVLP